MRKLTLICIAIAAGLALCQACGPEVLYLDDEDTGYLTFVNSTSHSVEVSIDGTSKGSVSGGHNRTWHVGSGSHTISWESSYGSGQQYVDCTENQTVVLRSR